MGSETKEFGDQVTLNETKEEPLVLVETFKNDPMMDRIKKFFSGELQVPEVPPCSHCNRVVYCGPPCCYDKLYEMYQQSQSDNVWLRKIQSKQAKTIERLTNKINNQIENPKMKKNENA